jgi:hypothetical protein
MRPELENLVEAIRGGQANDIGAFSTSEQCYIALAANRYDLLPSGFQDPIEAWLRLDQNWQRAVCNWRGWSAQCDAAGAGEKIAAAIKIVARCATLGIHDFTRSQATRPGKLGFAEDVCEGLETLMTERESLRETLKAYGRHDPGCSADINEAKYRCRCGWKHEREQLFGE